MKTLLLALSLVLTTSAWASNPEQKDPSKPMLVSHTVLNADGTTTTLDVGPLIAAHDLVLKEVFGILLENKETEAVRNFSSTCTRVRSHLRSEVMARIRDTSGNVTEFNRHHAQAMETVPLSLLYWGIQKGWFKGVLQPGPVYTEASERYYQVDRFLCGENTMCTFGGVILALPPPSLWTLTQLNYIDFDSNRLTYAPARIGNLTQLDKLFLAYNLLTSLPSSIGNLLLLTGLWLQNNRLTSLPESLWTLPQLTTLCLSDNHLTSLPSSIGNLTQLSSLDLDGNPLTTLPKTVTQLINLENLWLSPHQWADPQMRRVVEILKARQRAAGKKEVAMEGAIRGRRIALTFKD